MTLGADTVLARRYRLISLLGSGGMGEVWRAEQLDLKALVAVKIMNPTHASDETALQRFNREAQAAAALRSPHVVQILEHGFDSEVGVAFIAMELMTGESLGDRLRKVERLPPADTLRVVTHVARALTRAHEAGIVHRDLKPDNIFLVANDDEELAKVLDFGVAKAATGSLDVATRSGAVMGTPYYMSPEQIAGEKRLDFRTDLWALGVIVCECVTGRRPFEAETFGGLALAICTKAPPRPSSIASVPPGFDGWFERAVMHDPAQRFQSARELVEQLRPVLTGAEQRPPAVAAESQGGTLAVAVAETPARLPSGTLSSAYPLVSTAPPPPAARSRGRTFALVGVLGVAAGLTGLWLFQSRTAPTATAANAAEASPSSAPSLPTATASSLPPPQAAPPAPSAPSEAASVAPISGSPEPKARPPAPLPARIKPRSQPVPSAKPAGDGSSIFDRRKG